MPVQRTQRGRRLFPSGNAAGALVLVVAAGFAGAVPSVADPAAARFAAAFAAPCSSAAHLYETLATDSTIPDSLRAIACGRRGDFAFTLHDYKTALSYYNEASRLYDRRGAFKFRAGLAALGNGDTAEAETVFLTLTREGDGTVRNEAALLLGEIALQLGQFVVAMADFQSTGPFARTNGWSIRATEGKLVCARRLGMADSAIAYEKLLSPYRRTLLEKESVDLTPTGQGGAAVHSDTLSVPGTGAAGAAFTLQVGAFGSRERADAVKRMLIKQFSAVSCMPASVTNQTIFRVRVGDFRTREEAELFGKERLAPQGFAYRVVAK